MHKIALFLILISTPNWYVVGMDKEDQHASNPPTKKKTVYNLSTSKPKVPTINIQPPSQPQSTVTSPRLLAIPKTPSQPEIGTLISPRIQPKNNTDADALALGDTQLYAALISNDPATLNNFLRHAESDESLLIWWQDFISNGDIGSAPLTADNSGRSYTLIDMIIKQDTTNPIDGSYCARIEAIFEYLHPNAQRDIVWLDTAQKYNNESARLFISQQTMKRDHSSYISGDSDDGHTPRKPSEDGDDSYTLEDSYEDDEGEDLPQVTVLRKSTDNNDSSDGEEIHPPISPTQFVEPIQTNPRSTVKQLMYAKRIFNQRIVSVLLGVTACVIVCALLRAWYTQSETDDETSEAENSSEDDMSQVNMNITL